MNTDFHRIRRLPPYVFAHIDPIKAKLRASGVDIIDLGMGNPDMPTPAHIVEKLQETVKDPRTHRYSTSRGIPGLRKAQASYYGRRFGVKLDPNHRTHLTIYEAYHVFHKTSDVCSLRLQFLLARKSE